jgi:transposase
VAIEEPGKAGPKSILTDELIEEIRQLVDAGNYVDTACAAVGISPAAYYKWGRIGEKLIGEAGEEWSFNDAEPDASRLPGWNGYEWQTVKFVATMKKATARSEAYAVAIVRKHMPHQWTAAMTYLERRYPSRWKRRDLHEVAQAQTVEDTERALLENPDAVDLMHEALDAAAKGELTEGS